MGLIDFGNNGFFGHSAVRRLRAAKRDKRTVFERSYAAVPDNRRELREELLARVMGSLCRHLVEILKDDCFYVNQNIAILDVRLWEILLLRYVSEFVYDGGLH